MSDSPLRAAREQTGLSREHVARRLEPPTSVKTLERWEAPGAKVKRWRLEQLARIYAVEVTALEGCESDALGAR